MNYKNIAVLTLIVNVKLIHIHGKKRLVATARSEW